ncbi:MAG: ATP-binding cassette domain-containing protein [Anaerolineae bacterium]
MPDPVVVINHLAHTYLSGTPMAVQALSDASLTIVPGTITAIVGPNGAGKSTLLHYMNALLRPRVAGSVHILGRDTSSPGLDIGHLRKQVGLVMQYPHQQLFERFVGDDIAYGPRQEGLPSAELRSRVYRAMEMVGLDPAAFVDRHTFSLSGGEMRRVALAGVLAMQPSLLILDEVTTGLDPRGRRQVHEQMKTLRNSGITLVFTSNDMDEVLELADKVVVLQQGKTVAEDAPLPIFNSGGLAEWGLLAPSTLRIRQELASTGVPLSAGIATLAELEEALWQAWKD